MTSKDLKLTVTLWPSMPHFEKFSSDTRLTGGIRLNSAMIDNAELDTELQILPDLDVRVPLYFDVKGQQLRVESVEPNPDNLVMTLNHPIWVDLHKPLPVLFKSGNDHAELVRIDKGGKRLIFNGGPHFMVNPGESIHIRHPSLRVLGQTFTEIEKLKIEKVRKFGFKKYYLSYVENQRMVDEFEELIGPDCEIMLKIENQRGLNFVRNEFQKRDNLKLVAARGDLFIELFKPHQILNAVKLIIDKDPEAVVGSRILLSIIKEPVPSCADLSELAWLYDIGYRNMLLCDELCLKEELLGVAVNVFEAFRDSYASGREEVEPIEEEKPIIRVVHSPRKGGWPIVISRLFKKTL